jgi:hypothetical protein
VMVTYNDIKLKVVIPSSSNCCCDKVREIYNMLKEHVISQKWCGLRVKDIIKGILDQHCHVLTHRQTNFLLPQNT